MKVVIVTIILLLFFIAPVFADGNELLVKCQKAIKVADGDVNTPLNSSDAIDVGFCFGLLQGIRDMNMFYQVRGNSFFCLPKDGISNGQAARIVVNYLRSNPARLHKPESGLALEAFIKSYPCK